MTVGALELSHELRDDLGWRRKEILYFTDLIRITDSSKRAGYLRGATTVLYAHWEGFVKFAGQSYLRYVRDQRLLLKDLNDVFVALALRKRLIQVASDPSFGECVNLVEWLRESWPKRAQLPKADKISTRSNLNAEVFKDIIAQLGLPYRDEYRVAEKPVIERLVTLRNTIAHGSWQKVEESEWREQLQPRVDEMFELLCADIEDAAFKSLYERPPSGPLGAR